MCVCGKDVYLPANKVNSFHTKSCGCKSKEFISNKNSTHRLSKHPLFKVWANIISRCYAEYSSKYKRYGARGVRMCDLWKNNFIEFYNWALSNGWERGMQIDKDLIPKKLGIPALLYSPETCCIVTNKQNCNERSTNRKIEYNGEVKTISEWADFCGIKQGLMRYRIDKWGIEKAISKPKGDMNKKRIVCETTGEIFESVAEAYTKCNINKKRFYKAINGTCDNVNGLIFKYLN